MLNVMCGKALPVGFSNPPGLSGPHHYLNLGEITMKTPLAVSALALIVGLSGMTLVVAGSSSASSHSAASTPSSQSAPYGRGNEFTRSWSDEAPTRSWNQGITPSQSKDFQSSPARPTTGKNCSLSPRFGFNDVTNFPTC